VHPDSGIASLSIALGHDASGFDLEGVARDSGEQRQQERPRASSSAPGATT
jgi:hypothetical protein